MPFVYFVQSFFKELFTFFYFPIWWYTKGLVYAVRGFQRSLQVGNRNLGVTLWIKNWFVPMFGQSDWQGRIISIFIRTVQIIIRTVLLFLWCTVSLVILLLWIFGPLFCVFQIIMLLIF